MNKKMRWLEILSTHSDIIIKPADKGGAIAVMNQTDYNTKVQRQLGQTDFNTKAQRQLGDMSF